MKKLTFTLFIALAVACLFSVPCNAKGKAKHVVFIGLDGWGSYSVPKADIPPHQATDGRRFLYIRKTDCTSLLQRRQLGKHVYGGRS